MKAHAYMIVGLAFGDCGKGSMVDYLARLYGASLLVRYSGGPQAAHTVVLSDGRSHAFAQFGSASFIPGVRTHLSRYMLIEPFALMNEAGVLARTLGTNREELLGRLTIDPDCLVITPFHWMLNRLREKSRGDGRHGSCGMGVGEARAMEIAGEVKSLFLSYFQNKFVSRSYLENIREYCISEGERVDPGSSYLGLMRAEDIDALAEFYYDFWLNTSHINETNLRNILRRSVSIFEGAQGVLLDEVYGFAPYNSWTNTTAGNAKRILRDIDIPRTTIGVVRTYFTRHGPGPFVSECEPTIQDRHNGTGKWQGKFRTGLFDLVAFRYSLRCAGGVDEIALTHVDHVGRCLRYVDGYRMSNGNMVKEAGELNMPCWACDLDEAMPIVREQQIGDGLVSNIFQELIGLPVSYVSWGETAKEKAALEQIERKRA